MGNSPASLIILCVTIGVSLYSLYYRHDLIERFLFSPWRVFYQKKWYLSITSGFLHGDLMHLLFNMLTFYFFAFPLERTIGVPRFLVIYFGSMVLSHITTLLKNKDNPEYRSLGASGGISGVLFSFVLFYPKESLMIFMVPFPIPAPVFALLYLVYCYWAARKAKDLINHEAHFWGALAGIVLTVLMFPEVIEFFLKQIGV